MKTVIKIIVESTKTGKVSVKFKKLFNRTVSHRHHIKIKQHTLNVGKIYQYAQNESFDRYFQDRSGTLCANRIRKPLDLASRSTPRYYQFGKQ